MTNTYNHKCKGSGYLGPDNSYRTLDSVVFPDEYTSDWVGNGGDDISVTSSTVVPSMSVSVQVTSADSILVLFGCSFLSTSGNSEGKFFLRRDGSVVPSSGANILQKISGTQGNKVRQVALAYIDRPYAAL